MLHLSGGPWLESHLTRPFMAWLVFLHNLKWCNHFFPQSQNCHCRTKRRESKKILGITFEWEKNKKCWRAFWCQVWKNLVFYAFNKITFPKFSIEYFTKVLKVFLTELSFLKISQHGCNPGVHRVLRDYYQPKKNTRNRQIFVSIQIKIKGLESTSRVFMVAFGSER